MQNWKKWEANFSVESFIWDRENPTFFCNFYFIPPTLCDDPPQCKCQPWRGDASCVSLDKVSGGDTTCNCFSSTPAPENKISFFFAWQEIFQFVKLQKWSKWNQMPKYLKYLQCFPSVYNSPVTASTLTFPLHPQATTLELLYSADPMWRVNYGKLLPKSERKQTSGEHLEPPVN